MKVILLLMASCLAVHNGEGAPTAVYQFVRCNPQGDQANCVAQQTPEMAWSADLPARLPPSAAQYLAAEPVEDERSFQPEQGSGAYEGSSSGFIADRPFVTAESEIGSGEYDMDLYKGGAMSWLMPGRSVVGDAKPAEQELKDDHLLQL